MGRKSNIEKEWTKTFSFVCKDPKPIDVLNYIDELKKEVDGYIQLVVKAFSKTSKG